LRVAVMLLLLRRLLNNAATSAQTA